MTTACRLRATQPSLSAFAKAHITQRAPSASSWCLCSASNASATSLVTTLTLVAGGGHVERLTCGHARLERRYQGLDVLLARPVELTRHAQREFVVPEEAPGEMDLAPL